MGLLPSSRLFATPIWGDVSCSTRGQSTAAFRSFRRGCRMEPQMPQPPLWDGSRFLLQHWLTVVAVVSWLSHEGHTISQADNVRRDLDVPSQTYR